MANWKTACVSPLLDPLEGLWSIVRSAEHQFRATLVAISSLLSLVVDFLQDFDFVDWTESRLFSLTLKNGVEITLTVELKELESWFLSWKFLQSCNFQKYIDIGPCQQNVWWFLHF